MFYEQTRQIAIEENYYCIRYILEETIDTYVRYGIKVEMTDLITGISSMSVVNDITTEIEMIEAIYQMVYEGIVTPISLRDVIEDLIEELLQDSNIGTKAIIIA